VPRAVLLTTLLILLGCGEEAAEYGPGHAVPRLIAEAPALVPGTTAVLGVTFDIEPGWHLYWNGLNDTGYPVQITLELPEGFAAEETLWPAPERHVSPGNILDHVYTGRVTLLVPVRVPADASPGAEITVRCRAEWLACREACVPGKEDTELTLRVASPGESPGNGGDPGAVERLAEARRRLPVPLEAEDPRLRWSWEARTLVLSVAGARSVAFYPYLDCAELESVLRDGASTSSELRLELAKNVDPEKPITGVLAATQEGSPTRFYSLTLPLPES
jgi:thiol:disulfide interchange protein DsbD